MESKLYAEILEIKKQLDKKFAKNAELRNQLNKTDSLSTYLFSNPPRELKESERETNELVKKTKEVSGELEKMGFIINGKDYTLERIDENKMKVESAKYGFIVQYNK